MPVVTIIDYGLGNLLSVTRAILYCGAKVKIAEHTEDIVKAERLVLPGVGAFADGMKELKARGYIEPIREYVAGGNPFLGICLGMQLMMKTSSEFGFHQGLDIIEGRCEAIPKTGIDGHRQKIPHIGWNKLKISSKNITWRGTILEGIAIDESMYFVHSYGCIPEKSEVRLADAFYNGHRITAVVKQGKTYGCQFHPEKSGEMGLKVIRNFINISCK